jgi:3-hydroxybutyryl-CoA dehydrogenase
VAQGFSPACTWRPALAGPEEMMAIKTVGVLGCGLMGSGIAQVCAAAGYKTIVREVEQGFLDKGLARVRKFLDEGVSKGKVTGDYRDATLANLTGTTAVDVLEDCDLVIEAIVENLDEKRRTYAALEPIVGAHTVFASNTSSLCITELAAATKRPDRFGGLHFFNPVPLMKLVEVIRALTTSDETYQALYAFAQSLGKEPITAPDRPGFIVNRLLVPYLLDAIRAYENGLGTLEDIDKGMKLGCGYPMGPFTLLDFVGLDTTYYIANIMFEEFREPAYAPPPLLKRMVLAGYHGRKSGRGFYSYA